LNTSRFYDIFSSIFLFKGVEINLFPEDCTLREWGVVAFYTVW
jgi:hypothetical protein